MIPGDYLLIQMTFQGLLSVDFGIHSMVVGDVMVVRGDIMQQPHICVTFVVPHQLLHFISLFDLSLLSHLLRFIRQLYQWLETCEEEGVEMEPNSAAGIRMGMGTFNLVCVCVGFSYTYVGEGREHASQLYLF